MEEREKKNRLAAAKEKIMKQIPIERLKKMAKYRNLKNEQYTELMDQLEKFTLLLLESYIFEQNRQL